MGSLIRRSVGPPKVLVGAGGASMRLAHVYATMKNI